MSETRVELRDRRPSALGLIRRPLFSLRLCLSEKVLSSGIGPGKPPLAEPHTKTLSLCLFLSSFSFKQTHVHLLTHTLCVGWLRG